MELTLLFILAILITYLIGKNLGKKNERRLPAFIIAKYRPKDNNSLKKDEDYLLQVRISYPQGVSGKILNTNGLIFYATIYDFLKDWEPQHCDADRMQVYLGGNFEFEFPKNFGKKPSITNYDTTEHAYLKLLFEEYGRNYKKSSGDLAKIMREIELD